MYYLFLFLLRAPHYSFVFAAEKPPQFKSTSDVFSISTNNVLVGSTSSLWNAEGGRERGELI